jgi:hypothetical protein
MESDGVRVKTPDARYFELIPDIIGKDVAGAAAWLGPSHWGCSAKAVDLFAFPTRAEALAVGLSELYDMEPLEGTHAIRTDAW